MARTAKPEDQQMRRGEILDVTRRLIYTKGYDGMSIQDILTETGMSKGAFYHYFDSKSALLEALIERMIDEGESLIRPIVADPARSALDKLTALTDSLSSWKAAQKAFVVALLRVWFSDDNALVRHRMNTAIMARMSPYFSAIVAQGVREGVFHYPAPERAGGLLLSVMMALQNSVGVTLFAPGADPEWQRESIVGFYDTYYDAIERLLGAPEGCMARIPAETVQFWIDALAST
jgi:AcrR family transcriptional regulator